MMQWSEGSDIVTLVKILLLTFVKQAYAWGENVIDLGPIQREFKGHNCEG